MWYLLQLLLRPSLWGKTIQRFDPALSPDVALVDLEWRHFAQRSLIWFLLQVLLLTPALPPLLLTLALWPFGYNAYLGCVAILLALFAGMLLATVVSIATGMTAGLAIGLYLSFLWSTYEYGMFDMVFGTDLTVLFGLTTALSIHTLYLCRAHQLGGNRFIRPRELIIGLMVSVIAFIVTLFTVVGTVMGRESYQLPGYSISLAISLTPGLLMALAVGWKKLAIGRAITAGVLLFLMLFSLYFGLGQEFGQDLGGTTLLIALTLVGMLIYHMPFLLIFGVLTRMIGPWFAILVASIGSLLVYPLLKQLVGYYNLYVNLALACGWIVLGLTMRWWQPLLLYPLEMVWNALLYRLDTRTYEPTTAKETAKARRRYIDRHAVFWDELQWIPYWGLDHHLVLSTEHAAGVGQSAISSVSATPQRWAAQAAQIELDARRLAHCTTVQEMAHISQELSLGLLLGPASALLRTFAKISEDIRAGLAQVGLFNQRLVLSAVENELNGLLRELTRSNERYAQRFRPVATQWRDVVAQAVQRLDEQFEERQEIANPYVVGVPLTKHQDIFVGRDDISRQIESILRSQNHPPILLYGQRRMGKTSLIYNLRWMLPNRILPLIVDLQGPAGLARNHAGFLYNLAKGIVLSAGHQGITLPPLTHEQLETDPFTHFDDWLDVVEAGVIANGRELVLLALDEFEALDGAFARGRLDADMVLGVLRHMIQHRMRFKLLLAGSHTLAEFTRWSSYLINAQLIHLSYLSHQETVQLIEQPIQNFQLSYLRDATAQIIFLTRGHPYLTQLLCSEIVFAQNQKPIAGRRLATKQDVELAANAVLRRGQQFFADIANNQLTADARASVMRLARLVQPANDSPAGALFRPEELSPTVQQILLERELIEPTNGHYRFQVELIRRWFAEQTDTDTDNNLRTRHQARQA
ncbi:MAG: hypothetical protein KDE53_15150 [Caldilineaceae bacterium]|nr:hypothetical protein [Caldilineaceae bacterium]